MKWYSASEVSPRISLTSRCLMHSHPPELFSAHTILFTMLSFLPPTFLKLLSNVNTWRVAKTEMISFKTSIYSHFLLLCIFFLYGKVFLLNVNPHQVFKTPGLEIHQNAFERLLALQFPKNNNKQNPLQINKVQFSMESRLPLH